MQKDIVEKNKILEIISGSCLYGINNEKSDKDYLGIFLPTIEYILGFKNCEEINLSIQNKDIEGKNTEKAIDRKFYEFRKYIHLALSNNPTILEILFVNEKNILYLNDIGRELLKIKHLFPHKGLKQKFLGYAFSQKHKMVIKKDNYFDLINSISYLNKIDKNKFLIEVVNLSNCPHFITVRKSKNNVKFISVGDLNFAPSLPVKKVLKSLSERIEKVGNRKGLLNKYGFDTKFASHLIRLMLEGIELLTTGQLKFPLKDRQLLIDIRNGKLDIEQVLKLSEDLENNIEDLTIHSELPSKPRTKEIEKFTIGVLYEHLRRSKENN